MKNKAIESPGKTIPTIGTKMAGRYAALISGAARAGLATRSAETAGRSLISSLGLAASTTVLDSLTTGAGFSTAFKYVANLGLLEGLTWKASEQPTRQAKKRAKMLATFIVVRTIFLSC